MALRYNRHVCPDSLTFGFSTFVDQLELTLPAFIGLRGVRPKDETLAWFCLCGMMWLLSHDTNIR